MPLDCRCFQRCRASMNASAAWSSTRCAWRWPKRAANTFIRPFTTLQRFRRLRRTIRAMGQRLRVKASFVIPSNWTIEEKAILLGLKKYGAIVADNSGGFFSISVSPDNRWPANCFNHLAAVSIDNFEVIQTTGPMEGPRSSNPPTVDAGAEQVIGIDEIATLSATITAPNGGATTSWRLYSGPASVQLTNPNN